jgi:putative ABC transport system ATP-binding protein
MADCVLGLRIGSGDPATIVLVTHKHDIAAYCSRTVTFKDGVLLSDEPNRKILIASETLQT